MTERILGQSQKTRIGRAHSKMEEMINDEGEENQPAHDHASRSQGCFHRFLAPVMFGAGPSVLDRQPDGVVNVDQDDEEEKGTNDPKKRSKVAQMFRVTVDPVRPEEDLQVAQEMADDKQDQDHAGRGHDHLSSDG